MATQHQILFDARVLTNEPSGVGAYVRTLLPAMAPLLDEGERLHVLLPSGIHLPLHESSRIELHKTDEPFGSGKGRRQAVRLASRIQAEVVHVNSLLTTTSFPRYTVLTIHDLFPYKHPEYCTFWYRLRWRFRSFRAVFHARRIITVSKDIFDKSVAFFGKRVSARGEVIPPPISPAFCQQSEARLDALRERYHLPEKFFFYIGSDSERKNLAMLLEAYRLLDPTATLPLALAGFEGKGSAVREQAEALKIQDRIFWLGVVPDEDIPALYAAAYAFLFPCLDEGFCYPVLEAMACGAPVICSALPALREVTAGAAKIVHPTDRQEWKNAIQSSIVSLDWRDTARRKGLARAADFTAAGVARKTLSVYRSLYRKKD